VEAVLEDFESAPIDKKMKAMLRFLEKMTLRPEELSAEDAQCLREVGLSVVAIKDAIGVAFAFNLIDRLADSFAFEVPPADSFAKGAAMMLKRGYKIVG
jgi:alkylhydroperoxidase family enzyme